VLEPVGMDPHGIDKDYEIIVPISTLMRRVMNIDYIYYAKLGFAPGTDLDAAVLEVEDILRKQHGLGPEEPNDFAMFTPVQVNTMVRSANRVFTLFLPLIAAVSILVGGLVVANLMFMTVNERRAEIGLRKALGARSRDIRTQFLAEAAAVTGLGGVLALGAGYAVLQVLAMHGQAVAMPWDTALPGVALAVGIGMISGLAPARRAAALDPVKTLR
jgi:putative ABC transport system permease protein